MKIHCAVDIEWTTSLRHQRRAWNGRGWPLSAVPLCQLPPWLSSGPAALGWPSLSFTGKPLGEASVHQPSWRRRLRLGRTVEGEHFGKRPAWVLPLSGSLRRAVKHLLSLVPVSVSEISIRWFSSTPRPLQACQLSTPGEWALGGIPRAVGGVWGQLFCLVCLHYLKCILKQSERIWLLLLFSVSSWLHLIY